MQYATSKSYNIKNFPLRFQIASYGVAATHLGWSGFKILFNMTHINCPCCNSEIELKKQEKFSYYIFKGKKTKVIHKNVCGKKPEEKNNE